jgi:hypothetical protein
MNSGTYWNTTFQSFLTLIYLDVTSRAATSTKQNSSTWNTTFQSFLTLIYLDVTSRAATVALGATSTKQNSKGCRKKKSCHLKKSNQQVERPPAPR